MNAGKMFLIGKDDAYPISEMLEHNRRRSWMNGARNLSQVENSPSSAFLKNSDLKA